MVIFYEVLCMDQMQNNLEWLKEKFERFESEAKKQLIEIEKQVDEELEGGDPQV